MSQNGQPGIEQLPYFREYVDQILKPNVGRIIEELRANFNEQVWAELVARMARDQGMPADEASLQRMRALLEEGLRLRLSTQIVAELAGGSGSSNGKEPQAMPIAQAGTGGRANVDVIDPAFPNNPLARAVGGVRSVSR